jgi:hypothetical protein
MTSSIRLCLNMGPQVAVLNWDNDQPEDFLGSPLSNKPTWRIYIPPLRVIPRNSHLSVYAWLGVWYPLGSHMPSSVVKHGRRDISELNGKTSFSMSLNPSLSSIPTSICIYYIYIWENHRTTSDIGGFSSWPGLIIPETTIPSTFWTLRPEMQLAILPLGHLHGG